MKTIGKPTPTSPRALKLGVIFGAILLLGLIAVAKLTGMTGAALSLSVMALLYFTAAAAILAPRFNRSHPMCG